MLDFATVTSTPNPGGPGVIIYDADDDGIEIAFVPVSLCGSIDEAEIAAMELFPELLT